MLGTKSARVCWGLIRPNGASAPTSPLTSPPFSWQRRRLNSLTRRDDSSRSRATYRRGSRFRVSDLRSSSTSTSAPLLEVRSRLELPLPVSVFHHEMILVTQQRSGQRASTPTSIDIHWPLTTEGKMSMDMNANAPIARFIFFEMKNQEVNRPDGDAKRFQKDFGLPDAA